MLIDPHLYESKILVCDDSSSHATMLQGLLRSEGVRRVEVVTDSRRVLPTISGHGDFALLVLDLDMPHLDGFEVLELLRSELGEHEQIPVVVITGVAGEDACLRALKMGANDFIRKPFDHTEVVLRVRNTLRLHDMVVRQREVNRDLERQVRMRTDDLERATDTFVHKLGQICEMCDKVLASTFDGSADSPACSRDWPICPPRPPIWSSRRHRCTTSARSCCRWNCC